MKFSLFKEYGALNSKPIFDAFEHSLLAKGYTVCGNDVNADVAVIWSVLWNGRMLGNKPVWEHYRKLNKPVVVLEVGSISRGNTWKVGVNGVNRAAYFSTAGHNSSRANKLGLGLSDYNTQGEYILVCGQHEKSLQWQHQPRMSTWFLQTYDEIRKHTDRPIVFRPHPRCRLPEIERGLTHVYRQEPSYVANTYDSYDLNFDNVWATVSWSSNPGIHSTINGVPAFVGPDSLAYPVANHNLADIENPIRPDRTQWLNDYAWTEYTVNEIAQGLPLENLTSQL